MADWAEKSLPTGTDGKSRPSIWDDEKQEWIVPKGRDGRQWVRDDSVESQLKKIKEKMGEPSEGIEKVRPVDGNGDSLFTGDHPGKVEVTNRKDVEFPDDYPDKDVKARLESMEETQKDMMDAIKKTNETLENVIKDGNVRTQLTGSTLEYYGKTKDDRPDADSVEVGTVFMAVKTQEIWQSDGEDWVEM